MNNFYKICLFLLPFSVLAQNEAWKNPSLPVEQRVKDLLSRMTMEEKASLLLVDAPEIQRLGVPAYNWSHEALHGVARSGKATVFPQAIALAATFDSSLIFKMATSISDEARAKYVAFKKAGISGDFTGLTFFSPNINIFRDPRWGRGMETYGEDPFLTSKIGVAYVKGMQGNNPLQLRTAACAKHFVAHSGPEKDRHLNNPTPSPKDFNETYLPHFKELAQEANVETFMVTYNKIYGIPLCASSNMIRGVIRNKLGYKGLVMTDGGALNHMHQGQAYTKNVTETSAMALKAGINFELGDQFKAIPDAVKKGMISEKTIDSSAAIVLSIRFRLGLFDDLESNPYNAIPESVINCEAHRELARKIATSSIVMLKNNGALPLNKNIKKIYAVGPNATNADVLFGNYNGFTGNMSVPLEGLVNRLSPATILEYRPGCRLDQNNITKADWTNVSHNFDAIVAYMGLSPVIEGEEGEAISSPGEGDRLKLSLPANQIEYLKKQRSYGNKPIILVLFGGSPIIDKEIYDLADAVLFAWYPGEEGGNTIADIILGNEVPSGRLPITFPASESDLPDFSDYSMKNRTYRFANQEPLFPFGFGLSYAKFTYSNLVISKASLKR
jgi:beta-glucosidase